MVRRVIVKEKLCFILGTFGAWIAGLFGGWNSAMTTLVLFMLADYLTGLIVAGVFKNSPKTPPAAGAVVKVVANCEYPMKNANWRIDPIVADITITRGTWGSAEVFTWGEAEQFTWGEVETV